jgi:hypothetical protein
MHKTTRTPSQPAQHVIDMMTAHLKKRGYISDYDTMVRLFGRQPVAWLTRNGTDGDACIRDILVKNKNTNIPPRKVRFVTTPQWNKTQPLWYVTD